MSVEDHRDERKRTTDQVSKIKDDLNTVGYLYVRISPGENPLLPGRHPAQRWRNFDLGSVGNVGTSCPDVKGEIQVEDP